MSESTKKNQEKDSAESAKQKKTVLVRRKDGTVVRKVVNADAAPMAIKETAVDKTKTDKKPEAIKVAEPVKPPKSTEQVKMDPPDKKGPPNKPKKEKGGSKRWLIIALIFLFGLIGLGTYHFMFRKNSHAQMAKLEMEYQKIQEEYNNLQTDFENLNNAYDSLLSMLQDPEKNPQLKSLKQQNDRLGSKIRSLMSRRVSSGNGGNGNGAGNAKLRKEITELKTEVDRLMADNRAALERANVLESEKNTISKDLSASNLKNTHLTAKNKELQDKIDAAARLKIEDLMAQGVKYKSATKFKANNKIKKMNKLQVCFTIGENPFAEPGGREIYIVIRNASGAVLSNGGGKVDVAGESIQYSIKYSVNYSNEEILACEYYDKNDEQLPSGTYNVDVYCEGQLAAQTSFVLE